jgi:acetyl-CoA C-acetyltransferase
LEVAVPIDPRTPVLVGVGQLSQRVDRGEPALEPADLMAEAARRAGADAGADVLAAVDTVRVVSLLSWRYEDPGLLVAQRLGLGNVRSTGLTTMGGNSPQTLVNKTALDILAGKVGVALLSGAEAWRTRMSSRNAGGKPDWTVQEGVPHTEVLGDELQMNMPEEASLGLVMPVQLYPIFDNALRFEQGLGMDAHRDRLAQLWAGFAEVAESNPHAWIQEGATAEEIRNPSADNRMIGFPYTKLMNSNNAVEQGAALLLCSAERAAALGVPRDRWVFPLAGSDAHEHAFMSQRDELSASPAIGIAGRAVLDLAHTSVGDVQHLDLYSCFPVAPLMCAQELGIDTGRQLTVTGGLTFAGGPWNNYVMHSIATMVDVLRADPGSKALVWANGGYLTKHAFGVYSTEPNGGFRHAYPQDEIDATPSRELAADFAGTAEIESWTVMHGKDNEPLNAIAALRLDDGRRAWGVTDDTSVAAGLLDGQEWIGQKANRTAEGQLSL